MNEIYRCYWEASVTEDDEIMYYSDLISSYPDAALSWFPTGKYDIYTASLTDFYIDEHTLCFKKSGDTVCGHILLRILPPRDLQMPFLMYRSNQTKWTSLPLCSKCADLENTSSCKHTEW